MRVDYFFDPACPFSWMTSKFVRRVAPHRDLDVDWRFISLRIINDGRYDDAGMAAKLPGHQRGLELLRVCAAAKHDCGTSTSGRLYEAMGTRIWEQSERRRPDHLQGFGDAEIREALAACDLPSDLADARYDASWDEPIRYDSETALGRTGRDVGTPIITFGPPDGSSFFGPVVSTVPHEQPAVEMWDALSTLAGHQDFAELKRSMRAPLDLPVFDRSG